MRIRTLAFSLAGILVIAIMLASCGGASSETTPGGLQTGNGALPGVVGSIGGGSNGGVGSASTPITFETEAPLGLNQAYKPEIVGGSAEYEDLRGTSAAKAGSPAENGTVATFPEKGSSVITGPVDGPGFDIIDLTMVADNTAANWNISTNTFTEGQAIDLWIKYQMNSTSNGKIDRHWAAADLGINKTDSQITTPQGTYTAKLDWTVPANSAKNNCIFQWDMSAFGTKKFSEQFIYNIVKPKPTSGFDVIDLTMMPDGVAANWDLAKATFNEGDKIDLWIKYELYSTSMNMDRHWLSTDIGLDYNEFAIAHTKGVYSVKLDYTIPYGTARTNAIFKFDVTGSGTNKVSANFPYDILATSNTPVVYPTGGDGDASVPGYGTGWAQLVAEDLLTNSDYDFNDFVGRMQATEYRNSAGNLTQIKMRIKAIARGAGYDAVWQLNFGSAFPGATAWAKVDQYYANGTRHGNEVIWKSSNGVSIPVFSPLRGALPEPPTSYATNTVSGTKFIDGDYADVLIFFNTPVAAGTYTPLPYEPELRVQPPSGSQYTVSWSTQSSDGWHQGTTNAEDGSVLAFIVPDTYAWPLEGVQIWNIYPGFMNWGMWMLSPNAGNTKDPNTYLVSPAPITSGSQFSGSPQSRTYWTGSTGQDEFHDAAPAGELSTLNLIKYLN